MSRNGPLALLFHAFFVVFIPVIIEIVGFVDFSNFSQLFLVVIIPHKLDSFWCGSLC